jgi:hypothetical protein
MSRADEERKLSRAGAYLGPFQMIPTPIRTLSDEYHDEPEPTDSEKEPEPEPPGLLRRLSDRIRRRARA